MDDHLRAKTLPAPAHHSGLAFRHRRPRNHPGQNRHVSQAGLDRDIFAHASIDLLAEASDAIPRTLNLLAQSAWFIAARAHASSIEPDHVHQAIKNIPSAHDKIIHP